MPTSEWQELMGRTGLRELSSRDVVRQLPVLSIGAGTALNSDAASPQGTSRVDLASNVSDSTSRNLAQQMTSLVSQITALNSTQLSQISALQGNTQALTQNTTSRGSGGSAMSTAGGIASSLFGGSLTLAPIISGLVGLFGGGGQSTPAPAPFMLPAPVQYQAGVTGGPSGSIASVDYGQTGQPRQVTSSNTTSVTVQVNALDSQSFLDHSDDIANAVKTAILSSNSLNDVLLSM